MASPLARKCSGGSPSMARLSLADVKNSEVSAVSALKNRYESLAMALERSSGGGADLGVERFGRAVLIAGVVAATPRRKSARGKLAAHARKLNQSKLAKPLPEPTEEQLGASEPTVEVTVVEGEGVTLNTDEELASLIMDLIHAQVYDPEKGLWKSYDSAFKPADYTQHGKTGWDSSKSDNARNTAREEINRLKNIEIRTVCARAEVDQTVNDVWQQVDTQIDGVKRRDIRGAVKSHIRLHIHKLVYGMCPLLW
eukprot:TRINITY_DN14799_c0_g1_i1.p1 TRINITY_DN14799_c0_g1~~TRINITY_DN14799_c0_g1_i1.p1  ORF type:complete len:282 (+),score=35.92 TRINITY_DN14799_c0_g1_i1:87-848(+)